jgi:ATP-dependent DNA helicase RecG
LYQAPLSQHAKARLNVMRESNDGFFIAEEDLRLRGPGELLGTRQTGLMTFRVAQLPEHEDMLDEVAGLAAIVEQHHPDNAEALMDRWTGERRAFARV